MVASTTPTYRIERLQADTPRVRDAASIQLAAFDPFTEYQSVIEPEPRPTFKARVDKLEYRINSKLRGGEESSHLGYVAVDETTGETVGMSYWMRPGRKHKLPDVNKMDDEMAQAWKGWETEKYSKLYAAFQGKMSEVLEERGEEGCW